MRMNKKAILSLVSIVIIGLVAAAWFVQGQLNSLQTQIRELQAHNSELKGQLSEVQNQITELELENRELQDRLNGYTLELAKERHLKLEITAFVWEGGFHPIVGVTLIHPYNVTIQNDDVVPVFGLTLTATLLRGGIKIGDEGVMRIGRLNVGETEVAGYGPLTTIGTSLDGAVCSVTLSAGTIVLDEWIGNIG